jgi:hypothetical protein
LVENDIPIAAIAGTSAGALVGGAFASGLTIGEIEAIGHDMRWRHVGRPTLSRFGLLSNARMEKYLLDRFPITRFEDLPIPFAAVATDLKSHDAVVMRDKGDVAFAIRASCTIPFVYAPCRDAEGRQLVVGGLSHCSPGGCSGAGRRYCDRRRCERRGRHLPWPATHHHRDHHQSMLTLRKRFFGPTAEADVVIRPHRASLGSIVGKELLKAGYEADKVLRRIGS